MRHIVQIFHKGTYKKFEAESNFNSLGSMQTVHSKIFKYQFSAAQIVKAKEGKFVMEELHNFELNYDITLFAGQENFVKNWD